MVLIKLLYFQLVLTQIDNNNNRIVDAIPVLHKLIRCREKDLPDLAQKSSSKDAGSIFNQNTKFFT